MNTTSNVTYTTLPTKKEILERLLTNNHITFDEMWVLLQEETDIRYVPMPYQQPIYSLPVPIQPPYWWGIYPPPYTADPNYILCQSKSSQTS